MVNSTMSDRVSKKFGRNSLTVILGCFLRWSNQKRDTNQFIFVLRKRTEQQPLTTTPSHD